jgi:hypothetical protein
VRGCPRKGAERYQRLYRRRAYLGNDRNLTAEKAVGALAKEYGIRDRRRNRLQPAPPVIAEQLELAV